MKAIPVKQKPMLLAFNFAGKRLAALQGLCDSLGVTLQNHTATDNPAAFSVKLGDLLTGSIPSTPADLSDEARRVLESVVFPEELFVLANLSGDTLDAFLKQSREQDLWIPLKAVATPTNQSWLPIALRSELMEEHAYMAAMEDNQAQRNDAN